MSQRPALGKGLASLFPPTAGMAALGMGSDAESAGLAVSNKDRIPGITLALTSDIRANPYQPRRDFDDHAIEELAASIRANGIIQPLVVRKNADGAFELIAGERRLRASKLAGLSQVPVVVRRSTNRESLELALIENIQRQDLNCVDEALAYFQLIEEFSLTQEELAVRVGKDRATVANHLRLLRLSPEILEDLKAGTLSFGHGKALLSLDEPDLRLRARARILEKGLSVRETEALVEELKGSTQSEAPKVLVAAEPSPIRERLMNLAQELTRRWTTRVELKGSGRRGKIVFHYASRQELDRLIEAMQNHS